MGVLKKQLDCLHLISNYPQDALESNPATPDEEKALGGGSPMYRWGGQVMKRGGDILAGLGDR